MTCEEVHQFRRFFSFQLKTAAVQASKTSSIKVTDDVRIIIINIDHLFILAGLRVNSHLVASCEFDVGL
jgi:hypothetical protein